MLHYKNFSTLIFLKFLPIGMRIGENSSDVIPPESQHSTCEKRENLVMSSAFPLIMTVLFGITEQREESRK
ncbi:hypothetical protein C5E24_05680 [Pectobacterium parmentieri]|uniref:Uncharacterized protein n=1 Tax=Pectobacterium parmentieri TaxID=1905730 RepID=A0A8B3F815_PECPM|nr:hypothetical protein C5E26_05835 [Pectobacterium parmentieri]AYH04937.1 hypothetical protein C5E25_06000 [Pectobacterium parmentieri]AYH09213.1 hypothetical protein C5E24_05680 [Pectobacterium parmentieri]AYH13759.1 hypothetical protein C5E23_05980 [Pectobacterium parmentieri]AYH22461.1 hypothetical protein C5E21_05980 [Pectobacterium parmentieri]